MNIPEDLLYTAEHEWIREMGQGVFRIGITDYAQDQLGDVVFVELPEVGRKVAKGDTVAVIESVKTASDIYAPVSGEVVAVNSALESRPETVNESPYEDGWLFGIAPSDPAEYDQLLDAKAYAATLDEE